MSHHDTMDVLAGFTILAAMVLFFATAAALVEWWDTTRREAVNPIRSQNYNARLGQSPCLFHSCGGGGQRGVGFGQRRWLFVGNGT
jgi:hypothetical protein